MKSIKVLHVITHLEPGGLETWLIDLSHYFRHSRINFDFSCKGPTIGSWADRAVINGCTVHHNKLGLSQLPYVYGLHTLIKTQKYDLIHIHTGGYAGLASLASFSTGVPCIVTYHSIGFPAQALKLGYVFKQLRLAYTAANTTLANVISKRVTATSNATLKHLNKDYMQSPNWTLLPLGIELKDVTPEISQRRKRDALGINFTDVVIVHVGSFRDAKNHEFILKLFDSLCERCVQIALRLLLIGDGPKLNAIQDQAKGMTNIARILFMGQQKNVHELLCLSDIFLMPSRHEGFGKAAIEASNAKLPVVASNVGGLREAVVDGVTGFLHELEDTESFLESLEKLVLDRGLRETLGENGRQYASKVFSIGNSARVLEEIYEDAINSKT